jgi:hypothetical protein
MGTLSCTSCQYLSVELKEIVSLHELVFVIYSSPGIIKQTNTVALSPRANYTD